MKKQRILFGIIILLLFFVAFPKQIKADLPNCDSYENTLGCPLYPPQIQAEYYCSGNKIMVHVSPRTYVGCCLVGTTRPYSNGNCDSEHNTPNCISSYWDYSYNQTIYNSNNCYCYNDAPDPGVIKTCDSGQVCTGGPSENLESLGCVDSSPSLPSSSLPSCSNMCIIGSPGETCSVAAGTTYTANCSDVDGTPLHCWCMDCNGNYTEPPGPSCGTPNPNPNECAPRWDCDGIWTPNPCTPGSTQTQICTDLADCKTETGKPATTRQCPSTNNWHCGEWGPCHKISTSFISNIWASILNIFSSTIPITTTGQQERTCTDDNGNTQISVQPCALNANAGQCGDANGVPATEAPGNGISLCATNNTASTPKLSNDKQKWTWTCKGANGTTQDCEAVNDGDAKCGPASSATYKISATGFAGALCAPGKPTNPDNPAFPLNGGKVTWGCKSNASGKIGDTNCKAEVPDSYVCTTDTPSKCVLERNTDSAKIKLVPGHHLPKGCGNLCNPLTYKYICWLNGSYVKTTDPDPKTTNVGALHRCDKKVSNDPILATPGIATRDKPEDCESWCKPQPPWSCDKNGNGNGKCTQEPAGTTGTSGVNGKYYATYDECHSNCAYYTCNTANGQCEEISPALIKGKTPPQYTQASKAISEVYKGDNGKKECTPICAQNNNQTICGDNAKNWPAGTTAYPSNQDKDFCKNGSPTPNKPDFPIPDTAGVTWFCPSKDGSSTESCTATVGKNKPEIKYTCLINGLPPTLGKDPRTIIGKRTYPSSRQINNPALHWGTWIEIHLWCEKLIQWDCTENTGKCTALPASYIFTGSATGKITYPDYDPCHKICAIYTCDTKTIKCVEKSPFLKNPLGAPNQYTFPNLTNTEGEYPGGEKGLANCTPNCDKHKHDARCGPAANSNYKPGDTKFSGDLCIGGTDSRGPYTDPANVPFPAPPKGGTATWDCWPRPTDYGADGLVAKGCTAVVPAGNSNGKNMCGDANEGEFDTLTVSDLTLCKEGNTVTNFLESDTGWKWDCGNDTSTEPCSASKIPNNEGAKCGGANGGQFDALTENNKDLCGEGSNATAFTPYNTGWNWTCDNGISTQGCSASTISSNNKKAACGPAGANGANFDALSEYDKDLCSEGKATAFTPYDTGWNWTCDNGISTQGCSAAKSYVPVLRLIRIRNTFPVFYVGWGNNNVDALTLDQRGKPMSAKVNWKSNNPSVATVEAAVNNSALITGKSPGSTDIIASATASDGREIKSSTFVLVKPDVNQSPECGDDIKKAFPKDSAPTKLCKNWKATKPKFDDFKHLWDWICSNPNPNFNTVDCATLRIAECGKANGGNFDKLSEDDNDLCEDGKATAFTPYDTGWNWTCDNGISTQGCSASKNIPTPTKMWLCNPQTGKCEESTSGNESDQKTCDAKCLKTGYKFYCATKGKPCSKMSISTGSKLANNKPYDGKPLCDADCTGTKPVLSDWGCDNRRPSQCVQRTDSNRNILRESYASYPCNNECPSLPVLTTINIRPLKVSLTIGGNPIYDHKFLFVEQLDQEGGSMEKSAPITWELNRTVATIDNRNTVKAMGIGETEAIATATAFDGTIVKSKPVKITVEKSVLSKITVTPSPVKLTLGGDKKFTTAQLKAEQFDQNGFPIKEYETIFWTDDEAGAITATVDSNGLVTAVNPGTTKITARAVSSNGGVVKNSSIITVTKPTNPVVTEIIVEPSPVELIIDKKTNKTDSVKTLHAKALDQNLHIINDAPITWEARGVTVSLSTTSGNSTIITGQFAGTAEITASSGSVKSNPAIITVKDVTPVLTYIEIVPWQPNTLHVARHVDANGVITTSTSDTAILRVSKTLDQFHKPIDPPPFFEWESSDDKVATVNTYGDVTAVAPGTTYVFASSEGSNGKVESNKAIIKVEDTNPPKLSKIKISPESLSFTTAQVIEEKIKIEGFDQYGKPISIPDESITWTSTNRDAVYVILDGDIIPGVAGEAIITASSEGVKSNEASIKITQSTTPVLTYIEIKPEKRTLILGGNIFERILKLNAKTIDQDHNDIELTEPITWKSTNEKAATVNRLGEVEAVSVGQTEITASSGGVTSNKSFITVTSPTGTQPAQEWACDINKKCVLVVDGVPSGKKYLIDNNCNGECGSAPHLDKIKIVSPPASMTVGDTAPARAESYDQYGDFIPFFEPLTWTLFNTEVARLNDNTVKAISVGTALLTASSEGVKSELTITVGPTTNIKRIHLNPPFVNLSTGETSAVTATAFDGNDDLVTTTFTWKSSSEEIAKIDSNGTITAINPGEATITATSEGVTSDETTVIVKSSDEGTPPPPVNQEWGCTKPAKGKTSQCLPITKDNAGSFVGPTFPDKNCGTGCKQVKPGTIYTYTCIVGEAPTKYQIKDSNGVPLYDKNGQPVRIGLHNCTAGKISITTSDGQKAPTLKFYTSDISLNTARAECEDKCDITNPLPWTCYIDTGRCSRDNTSILTGKNLNKPNITAHATQSDCQSVCTRYTCDYSEYKCVEMTGGEFIGDKGFETCENKICKKPEERRGCNKDNRCVPMNDGTHADRSCDGECPPPEGQINGECGDAATTYFWKGQPLDFKYPLCKPGHGTAVPNLTKNDFPTPGNSITWTCKGSDIGYGQDAICTATVRQYTLCGPAAKHYPSNAIDFEGELCMGSAIAKPDVGDVLFPEKPGDSVEWTCTIYGGNSGSQTDKCYAKREFEEPVAKTELYTCNTTDGKCKVGNISGANLTGPYPGYGACHAICAKYFCNTKTYTCDEGKGPYTGNEEKRICANECLKPSTNSEWGCNIDNVCAPIKNGKWSDSNCGGTCSAESPQQPEAPYLKKIILIPSSATLNVGEAKPMLAEPVDQNGKYISATITWKEGNPLIAAFDPITGNVTGVSVGQTIITASGTDSNGHSVKSAPAPIVVTNSKAKSYSCKGSKCQLLPKGETGPFFTSNCSGKCMYACLVDLPNNKNYCQPGQPDGKYIGNSAEETCKSSCVKWKCVNKGGYGLCVPAGDDPNAKYSSLEECNNDDCFNNPARYYCEGSQCKLATNGIVGPFKTTNCNNKCAFACLAGTPNNPNVCKFNQSGKYTGQSAESNCKTACVNYKCDTTLHKCVPVGDNTGKGIYSNKGNCDDNCQDYTCDKSTGKCIKFSEKDPKGTYFGQYFPKESCEKPGICTAQTMKCTPIDPLTGKQKNTCSASGGILGKTKSLYKDTPSCDSACANWRCVDPATQKCEPAGDTPVGGEIYAGPSDATCKDACQLYKCDRTTGQCGVAPKGSVLDAKNKAGRTIIFKDKVTCENKGVCTADKYFCTPKNPDTGEAKNTCSTHTNPTGIKYPGLSNCQGACVHYKCTDPATQTCVPAGDTPIGGEVYSSDIDCWSGCLPYKCDKATGTCDVAPAGSIPGVTPFVYKDKVACEKKGVCTAQTIKCTPIDPLTGKQKNTCSASGGILGKTKSLYKDTPSCQTACVHYKCTDPATQTCVPAGDTPIGGEVYSSDIDCWSGCLPYKCDKATGTCDVAPAGSIPGVTPFVYKDKVACEKKGVCTGPQTYNCMPNKVCLPAGANGKYTGLTALADCTDACNGPFTCDKKTWTCIKTKDKLPGGNYFGNYNTKDLCLPFCNQLAAKPAAPNGGKQGNNAGGQKYTCNKYTGLCNKDDNSKDDRTKCLAICNKYTCYKGKCMPGNWTNLGKVYNSFKECNTPGNCLPALKAPASVPIKK